MALHLNLLHEQILEQRQRQRDPLKIGLLILVGLAVLLFLFYSWRGYQLLHSKSRLGALEHEWKKSEPALTAAKSRIEELNRAIKTTRTLDDYIDDRFLWAPFLQKMAGCVAPNMQLISLSGTVGDENKGIDVVIEGVAAGSEPRSVAEDLRQMLLDQLKQLYADVKAEFRSLEDIDQVAVIGGVQQQLARYILVLNLKPNAPKPTPAPASARAR
jgi:hypothetical protein